MAKHPRKVLGIIGDPVSHSLSPVMQNAALAHLRLPYIYVPFHVKPEGLKDFFRKLKIRRIAGLNVTIPHKQGVIPFLDSLSREAKLIGAVNTIILRNKKWVGHNTDGEGYVTSLKREAGYNVRGKHVTLIGAGGAARAIAVTLGMEGAREVLILNRTAKRAFDLAHELNRKFAYTVFAASRLEKVEPYIWPATDLLINATSVGMKSASELRIPLQKLKATALVSDIVYTPFETPLLKKARRHKLKIHYGWGMLLYQGALSFRLWTGRNPPIEVMKKTLLDSLSD